jgi:hypothetical protein
MASAARLMTHDVDDLAVGIAHKEPSNAPGLVSERIDDRMPARERSCMGGVDVRHLHREIRLRALALSGRKMLTWAVGFSGEAKVTIQPMSIATSKPSTST